MTYHFGYIFYLNRYIVSMKNLDKPLQERRKNVIGRSGFFVTSGFWTKWEDRLPARQNGLKGRGVVENSCQCKIQLKAHINTATI